MARAKPKSKSRSKKSKLQNLFSRFSNKQLFIFAILFGLVGTFTLWKSIAAPLGICVSGTPGVFGQNTFAWAQTGSWGLPGQKIKYSIDITNYDQNCNSSVFTLNVAAPSGFVVSNPATTVTVNSASQAFLTIYVTSPVSIADGTYPITLTVTRSASPTTGTNSTSYKVYSIDTTAPSVYWTNPSDGQIVSTVKGKNGSNLSVSFESQDDHAVKRVEEYIDNALLASTNCDDISPACGVSFNWPLKGHSGSHIATFKSYDWLGNVGTQVNNFTVN